jgi:hypothetical protein
MLELLDQLDQIPSARDALYPVADA